MSGADVVRCMVLGAALCAGVVGLLALSAGMWISVREVVSDFKDWMKARRKKT